ncbi:MAG: hypothetical protein AABX03_01630 [Nanoarchaeota archaeon]
MIEEMFRRTGTKDVILILIASVAVVGFWRGVWNLMDRYFLPEYFLVSQIVTIILGTLMLFLLSRIK